MKWDITATHNGWTIKTFLAEEGQFSKRLIIKAKSEAGQILVNGVKETVRYVLQEGDKLEVILPPEIPAERMTPEDLSLDIVYEDAFLLVINKPAGMASMPSRHHPTGTLANGLLFHYRLMNMKATIHIVTRLDKDTSGIVVVAKSTHCHALLSNLQRQHALKRKYIAIVDGVLRKDKGTISQPIGRAPNSIIKRTVREDGQHALTHFKVLHRLPHATVLLMTLETGRTHQIRVHAQSIGHPLKGDTLYGGSMHDMTRQALHCYEVAFLHPYTKEEINVYAPLPADMQQTQAYLP